MKAFFDQTTYDYSQELSLLTPKYSHRSATHTRSSSESTVVCPDYMSEYSSATIATAAAAPADYTLPCMTSKAAASVHAMPAGVSLLKAHFGAPSPMSIPTVNTPPIPSDHSARYRLRRDSLLCDMVADESGDDDANEDDDEEYSLPTPVSEPSDRDDDCLFDMDADRSHYPSMAQALDPKALSYRHMGKPEPWAVRPTELFNAHRAQIRAIDDDDNEFYL
ncbi:hypothetical protein GGH91_003751 [Coemansia sp. RSA 2671]|uniref:Uncharacterized protein n=1 Tax=Coemansia linderi TaxID=2663919 RepID=A0ACC1K095_9FUNG|nr:hypothetical protein LPJ60_004519 [Coemansia sp. RSA 2675]KAJ2009193.1 hypothetical protein GGI06_005214 [Coemansia sp. S85]KAJ2341739.1 hypothetical protein GGH91_003751 [Coemansia sp. RSA 2671]KAJ2412330.1 hypothetical protein GGI10_003745 [Coemansia sp. RSA 2530]KAJ2697900.1 hypothetical protein H4218_003656 [Coemansia sp. IMI 209128]KAJ2770953.1 hypothetical protein GGI18_005125 [Coemansia linderi]